MGETEASRMESFYYRASESDPGAIALVLDLADAFEHVSLPIVWAWATHFNFPGRFCGCCASTLSINGECSLRDAWRRRSRPSRPFSVDQSGAASTACCFTGRID